MQQRPPSSNRSPDNEHHQCVVIVKVSPQKQQEKMVERSFSQLPISPSHIGKRVQSTRRGIFPVSEKWVHAIPVVFFFCFFTLWWYSHPVTVEIKNGRIVAIHSIEKSPAALNETRVDIAILASATSPTAESLPENLTGYNGTERSD